MRATANNLKKIGFKLKAQSSCSGSQYYDYNIRLSDHYGASKGLTVFYNQEYGNLLLDYFTAQKMPMNTKEQRKKQFKVRIQAKRAIFVRSQQYWQNYLKGIKNEKHL